MKIFHKKFLNQELSVKNSSEDLSKDKARIGYFLNQFLIWGVIFCIVLITLKFLLVDYN